MPVLDCLEDRTLLSTFWVTNTGVNSGVNPAPGAGTGTLRQAIIDADAAATGTAASPDQIQFNIPTTDPGYNSTTGAFSIKPLSALPTVTDTVVLDGYTQAGASPNSLTIGDNAVLKIVLDRSLAGSANGLVILGGNSTVRGLVIDNFAAGNGLTLTGGGNDLVVSNFIGTDATGSVAAANSNGIFISSPGDVIGGTSPANRNIISGNNPGHDSGGNRGDNGIALDSSGNLIQGNYIGTDKSGTFALGNGAGVDDGSSSSNQTIGGTSAGAGNVISGNAGDGVFLGADNLCLVAGNLIGTTATGLAALGNGNGIELWGNNNTIGGTTAAARNIISGNLSVVHIAGGIDIVPVAPGGAQHNLVEGNYIGTDVTGTIALGGQAVGIGIAGAYNTIGGTTAAARNIISGNTLTGIDINSGEGSGFDNVVLGNYIGTDPSGTRAVPNNYWGIVLDANGNTIGGTLPGAGNVISGNGRSGVFIDSGTGDTILSNSIFSNGSPGILLNSANNANNNQAFPVLTSVFSSSSGTTITGTLQSVASTTFRIEFFANATADPSGFGQGQTFLGAVNVTTNSSGAGSFTFTLTTPLPAGQTIFSATATKLVGTGLTPNDTSQFCHDVSIPTVGPITAPLAPVAVNTAISVSASFTDAITSATHSAVWNWGDSTTSPGIVTETNGSGTVTGSHAYAVDGVYTVTLTVTNNLGGSGQSVFNYVVVFNPSAGFVTGGGWFNSPAGAYAANPNLSGQANFGLNAKYQSGATVPTGNTEFQFPAANLNFHATSYDWLVLTANQAQYQGSGTINGAGNFGFLVTALDNGGTTADLFRMRIWDKNNNNAVAYDTQPGAPTTASPTTALGGGRIQAHTNAQLVAGGANPGGGNVALLTPEELQPIVQQAIAGWGAAGIDAARLSALSQVTVGIAEFPGPWLGMAFPGAIWIDQNAAGYGWYIDATSAAAAALPASGQVDLLTVVEHELGHVLGLDDTAGAGLMGQYLAPGTRRVPIPAQPAGLSAGQATGTLAVALAAQAGQGSPMAAPSLLPEEVGMNPTAAAHTRPTARLEVTPNGSVLPGIPANGPKAADPQADPTSRTAPSLAEVAADAPKSVQLNQPAAGAAPVEGPAVAPGVSLPTFPAARATQVPPPAVSGADVVSDSTGPDADVAPVTSAPADSSLPADREPAQQVLTRAASPSASRDGRGESTSAAVDAFFLAAERLTGGPIRPGTNEGQADRPAPRDVAAADPLLFALLGVSWAARDEAPESRKPRRPRRG
jgi:hypothetical protein